MKKGYGLVGVDLGQRRGRHGRLSTVTAHRLAAHLWLGFDLNDPRFVLHRCDNPPCFNPDHLFIGTVQDNQADMAAKGRSPNRKLTEDDVRRIRTTDFSCRGTLRALAIELGVDKKAVMQVRDGLVYRWVT